MVLARRRKPRDLRAWRVDSGDSSVVIVSYELEPLALDMLTAAERAVVNLALGGSSNAEIARARGTSIRTIANLLARSYRKLGVSSRRELAAKLGPT